MLPLKRAEVFEDWSVEFEVPRGILKMVVKLEVETELVLEMITRESRIQRKGCLYIVG